MPVFLTSSLVPTVPRSTNLCLSLQLAGKSSVRCRSCHLWHPKGNRKKMHYFSNTPPAGMANLGKTAIRLSLNIFKPPPSYPQKTKEQTAEELRREFRSFGSIFNAAPDSHTNSKHQHGRREQLSHCTFQALPLRSIHRLRAPRQREPSGSPERALVLKLLC